MIVYRKKIKGQTRPMQARLPINNIKKKYGLNTKAEFLKPYELMRKVSGLCLETDNRKTPQSSSLKNFELKDDEKGLKYL